MRNAIATLALAAAVGLLAGCGGGGGSKTLSKGDYIKQVTAIMKTFTTTISTLTTSPTAATAATALENVKSGLQGAVKQLDAITPPDEVKAAHDHLTAALGELAGELDPVIAKLKAGSLAALSSVLTLKGFRDLQAASAEFTKAGYQITLSG